VAGDDLDFRDFFLAEFERLSRLGFLLTGNWSEAEDLAQDALARTYRQWSQLRRGAHPSASARQVLVNRYRSLLRRALVETRHAWQTHVAEGYQPDLGEDAMMLWAAVERLPKRQRTVLVLRYQQDLPEAEVARLLGGAVGCWCGPGRGWALRRCSLPLWLSRRCCPSASGRSPSSSTSPRGGWSLTSVRCCGCGPRGAARQDRGRHHPGQAHGGPGRGQFYPTTANFSGIGVHVPSGPYRYSRRPDGRRVLLGEAPEAANAATTSPYYCRPGVRCAPITRARTLQVRFYAPAAAWPQVRRVGEAIVADVRPITNALPSGDASGVRPPCQLSRVVEGVDVYPSNHRPDRPITVQLLDYRLRACHLRAALQVVVRTAAGRPLAVQGGQRPVVVEGDLPEGSVDPTGRYRITWRWTNWCGPRSVHASVEAVGGPTPPRLQLGQADPPRCVDRARPSRIGVVQVVR
jgi:RNA polymerase sigma factor (sigma-70 family)